ncbi:hypothetical protein, partial [Paenibacillus harenae]
SASFHPYRIISLTLILIYLDRETPVLLGGLGVMALTFARLGRFQSLYWISAVTFFVKASFQLIKTEVNANNHYSRKSGF